MIVASVPLGDLFQLVFWALGITYVITRSDIGFLIRLPWCLALKYPHKKFGDIIDLWSPVLCPSCNAWWTGAVLAYYAGYDWITVAQFAFTSCLMMAILQRALGDIAEADDFESILGIR